MQRLKRVFAIDIEPCAKIPSPQARFVIALQLLLEFLDLFS